MHRPMLHNLLIYYNLSNGSNNKLTNTLAKDFADYISRLIINNKMENDIQPYPGLYGFLHDIYCDVGATPDGRRKGERLSYGCGPTEYSVNKTPTAILNSAKNLPHALCACGNPLTLSFTKDTISNEKGLNVLKTLIQSYFQGGGFHLHFNIVDADTLERAQTNPDEYGDLLVRISGLSAKFVTLDKKVQDAIIHRTKLGM